MKRPTSRRTRPADAARPLGVRLRTARGRRLSSTRWLQRQHNDPYVLRARSEGYRSRSAFKLLEIDARYSLLAPGRRVLDLGAAPGGWCQAALAAGAEPVVGIDLLPMEPLPGARLLAGDMRDAAVLDEAAGWLGGAADVVLSDMAAPATGHRATDRLRVTGLAEAAAAVARRLLAAEGSFVAKVMRSGTPDLLLTELRREFDRVRHCKPPASRPESDEIYIVATGFRPRGMA